MMGHADAILAIVRESVPVAWREVAEDHPEEYAAYLKSKE